jgi:hypothetical protein
MDIEMISFTFNGHDVVKCIECLHIYILQKNLVDIIKQKSGNITNFLQMLNISSFLEKICTIQVYDRKFNENTQLEGTLYDIQAPLYVFIAFNAAKNENLYVIEWLLEWTLKNDIIFHPYYKNQISIVLSKYEWKNNMNVIIKKLIHYDLFIVSDFLEIQVKLDNLQIIQWIMKNIDVSNWTKVCLFEYALYNYNFNILNWLYKDHRYIIKLLDYQHIKEHITYLSIYTSNNGNKMLKWLKHRNLYENVDLSKLFCP